MTTTTPTSTRHTTRRHNAAHIAAAGAAGICLTFAGLQVALAAGAPIGEHFWGGSQDRVLPTGMRFASVGASLLLVGMASTVARRAGLIGRPANWLRPATWTIAAYMAVNTLGNLASTSNIERYVFGTSTAVAAVLTAFVAYRTRR
ncbi:MAG: hypothetical protein AB8G14_18145 [Ilumatobacter sp.]